MGDSNDWDRWSVHVLAELERLNCWVSSVDKRGTEFMMLTTKQVTALQVKAGIWGASGGILGAAAVALTYYIKTL